MLSSSLKDLTDPLSRTVRFIKEQASKGKCRILITSDPDFLHKTYTRTILLPKDRQTRVLDYLRTEGLSVCEYKESYFILWKKTKEHTYKVEWRG